MTVHYFGVEYEGDLWKSIRPLTFNVVDEDIGDGIETRQCASIGLFEEGIEEPYVHVKLFGIPAFVVTRDTFPGLTNSDFPFLYQVNGEDIKVSGSSFKDDVGLREGMSGNPLVIVDDSVESCVIRQLKFFTVVHSAFNDAIRWYRVDLTIDGINVCPQVRIDGQWTSLCEYYIPFKGNLTPHDKAIISRYHRKHGGGYFSKYIDPTIGTLDKHCLIEKKIGDFTYFESVDGKITITFDEDPALRAMAETQKYISDQIRLNKANTSELFTLSDDLVRVGETVSFSDREKFSKRVIQLCIDTYTRLTSREI